MSKQANKTVIGAFVLGAIVLVVAGVLVFGSGRFLRHLNEYVLFFDGSVKGLSVGAPVMFRGVKIGQVTDIALELNVKDLYALVPVTIELDSEKIVPTGGDVREMRARAKQGQYPFLKALVEKGLKGQLQLQSLVTGQLMVSLELYPDKPIRLAGTDRKHPEIPTIRTDIQELAKKIEELNFGEIAAKLDRSLAGIDRFVNSAALHESIGSLNKLIKSLDRMVANTGNLGYQTTGTLEEIAKMSRSLRSLADSLERNPEALLKGKQPAKGE